MNVLFLDVEPLYDDLLPTGLRQVGCNVRTLSEVLDGRLEQELATFTPDFILTLGWSWFPTPERLELIREVAQRHSIPVVAWMTEDPCWHEHYSVPYVQRLQPDLVLTICAEYVAKYEAMGLSAACLPFGYNHDLYQPVPPRFEYACDIAIVANFYTTQFEEMNRKRSLAALVTPLLERGYNMRIWGSNWDRAPEFGLPSLPVGVWHGYLNHRETPAVYNSAKIVIGLQNEFDFETNLTMRTCEVMGAGGFLLTSRTRAVERFFVHGKHLVMSGSPAETLELVDHYLRHPKEREQIAAHGQALVEAQHTYAHRALEVLSLFSRLRSGRPMRAAFAVTAGPVAEETQESAHVGPGTDASTGDALAHRVPWVDPVNRVPWADPASPAEPEPAEFSGSLELTAATKSHKRKFPCHPYCCCPCCCSHHHHHHDCSDSSSSSSSHHHCDCSDSSSSHHHHHHDCSDSSSSHHHHHHDCSDSSSSHHHHHHDCSDSSSSGSSHHHCDCSDSSSSSSSCSTHWSLSAPATSRPICDCTDSSGSDSSSSDSSDRKARKAQWKRKWALWRAKRARRRIERRQRRRQRRAGGGANSGQQ
jgi:spore maturation protein CgeB